jgi:hypothetical protein
VAEGAHRSRMGLTTPEEIKQSSTQLKMFLYLLSLVDYYAASTLTKSANAVLVELRYRYRLYVVRPSK